MSCDDGIPPLIGKDHWLVNTHREGEILRQGSCSKLEDYRIVIIPVSTDLYFLNTPQGGPNNELTFGTHS